MRFIILGVFCLLSGLSLVQDAHAVLGGNSLNPASFGRCYSDRFNAVVEDLDPNQASNNVSGDPAFWFFYGGRSRDIMETFDAGMVNGERVTGQGAKQLPGLMASCPRIYTSSCGSVQETANCFEDYEGTLVDNKTSCENKVEQDIEDCADNRSRNPRTTRSAALISCRNDIDKAFKCGVETKMLSEFQQQSLGDGPLSCFKNVSSCSENSTNFGDFGSNSNGGSGSSGGLNAGGGSSNSNSSSGSLGGSSSSGGSNVTSPGQSGSSFPGSVPTSRGGSGRISISSLTGKRTTISTRTLSGNITLDRNGNVYKTRGSQYDHRSATRALNASRAQETIRASAPSSPSVERSELLKKAQCKPSLSPRRSETIMGSNNGTDFTMSTLDGFRGADTLHIAGVWHKVTGKVTQWESLRDATFLNVRVNYEELVRTKILLACGRYEKVHIGGSSNLRIVDRVDEDGNEVLSIDNIATCRSYKGASVDDDYKYALLSVQTHGSPSTTSKTIVLSGIEESHRMVCRQTATIVRTKVAFEEYLNE